MIKTDETIFAENFLHKAFGAAAVLGCVTGCVLGLPLNKMMFQFLIAGKWGTGWQLPAILKGLYIESGEMKKAHRQQSRLWAGFSGGECGIRTHVPIKDNCISRAVSILHFRGIWWNMIPFDGRRKAHGYWGFGLPGSRKPQKFEPGGTGKKFADFDPENALRKEKGKKNSAGFHHLPLANFGGDWYGKGM